MNAAQTVFIYTVGYTVGSTLFAVPTPAQIDVGATVRRLVVSETSLFGGPAQVTSLAAGTNLSLPFQAREGVSGVTLTVNRLSQHSVEIIFTDSVRSFLSVSSLSQSIDITLTAPVPTAVDVFVAGTASSSGNVLGQWACGNYASGLSMPGQNLTARFCGVSLTLPPRVCSSGASAVVSETIDQRGFVIQTQSSGTMGAPGSLQCSGSGGSVHWRIVVTEVCRLSEFGSSCGARFQGAASNHLDGERFTLTLEDTTQPQYAVLFLGANQATFPTPFNGCVLHVNYSVALPWPLLSRPSSPWRLPIRIPRGTPPLHLQVGTVGTGVNFSNGLTLTCQ